MTTTDDARAAGRIPSLSELHAALLAARNGQFATPGTTSRVVTPPSAAASPLTPPAPPPPASPAAAGQPASGGTGLWLLGTHGGSGVRCLSAVLPTTRYASKTWPTPQLGREPVVLVCRGNHRGLTAAQDYARAYRNSGLSEQLQLLGVIVSADAPDRIPPPLRRLERLLSGAAPILGHAPWEPTWRLGPAHANAGTEPLPWVGKLSRSLDQALAAAVTVPA